MKEKKRNASEGTYYIAEQIAIIIHANTFCSSPDGIEKS